MTPDTSDDVHARSTDRKTFRPHVDDYFRRRVRDDHAPNAALHGTLRALAESDASRIANVNLMASHAPGEKDHEPTYDVVVDIENAGGGSAATFGTIIRKLVRYDDVVIRDAEATSIPTDAAAHPGDTDYAVDRLTLHLRPVETRVEPVEVDYRHLPSDVFTYDTVRHNARMVLDHAVKQNGSNPRTYEAARCLATLLFIIDPDTDDRSFDPEDEDALRWIDYLTENTAAEWEFAGEDDMYVNFPPGAHVPYETVTYRKRDGSDGEVPVGVFDHAEDAVAAARAILDYHDVDYPVEPTGYAHDGDVRRGVPYDDPRTDDAKDWLRDDTDGARGALDALESTGRFGALLADLNGLRRDLETSGDDKAAEWVDDVVERHANRYSYGTEDPERVDYFDADGNPIGYAHDGAWFGTCDECGARHEVEAGQSPTCMCGGTITPPGYEAAADVDNRWVELRVKTADTRETDVIREKEKGVFADGDIGVYVDKIRSVDPHDERTTIPCGCGDFDVSVPSGKVPDTIDVVCPECGNHFGHGGSDE